MGMGMGMDRRTLVPRREAATAGQLRLRWPLRVRGATGVGGGG